MESTNTLNMNWLSPHKNSNKPDIVISIPRDKKHRRISFTFHNKCWKLMANNGACNRIQFAVINDNTIVFRCSKDGFKLVNNNNSEDTRYFRYCTNNNSDELLNKLFDFEGCYDLQKSEGLGYYYITTSQGV
jgi:hypothetical protein